MKNLKEISLKELITINGGATTPGVMSEPGNEGCIVPNPLDDILKN
ncbi:hypothetical protein JM83_1607 [Gillisia sp. Hel_I_86]|nr:hypothetical protein [Gillisia sp. Hel_I_86]TVZ26626.1 hypothetical protein JM83_1607 [Gillisia sp. Hel_I_86]